MEFEMGEIEVVYAGYGAGRSKRLNAIAEEASSRGLYAAFQEVSLAAMTTVMAERAEGLEGTEILSAIASASISTAMSLWHTHVINVCIPAGWSDERILEMAEISEGLALVAREVSRTSCEMLRRQLPEIRARLAEGG